MSIFKKNSKDNEYYIKFKENPKKTIDNKKSEEENKNYYYEEDNEELILANDIINESIQKYLIAK